MCENKHNLAVWSHYACLEHRTFYACFLDRRTIICGQGKNRGTSDLLGVSDLTKRKKSYGKPRLPEMGMPFTPWFCFHRCQPLQDTACIHGLLSLTALTQLAELLLELGQIGDTDINVGDVLIQ